MTILRWDELNDAGLTGLFIARDPDHLRYCPSLGWFEWDGKVWIAVSGKSAHKLIRGFLSYVAQELAVEESEAKAASGKGSEDHELAKQKAKAFRSAYQNSSGATKFLNELMANPTVLIEDPARFDADAHLLNCQNGVVDLRTGDLLKHEQSYLMTKICGASYIPGATHPDIEKTLDALGDLSATARTWLRRLMGSCCAGEMPADDLNAIFQGGGANGKSTFIAAAMAALGSYAGIVPDSVMTGSHDAATGIAEFKGRRMMVVEETPEGMRLDMQIVKKLSSGNEITGRVLYKGVITFRPVHTLILLTNHRPVVRETDRGTWRRLAFIPFTRTFAAGEKPVDLTLRGRVSKSMTTQADAMLAWLVMGAVSWYGNGRALLPLPAEIEEATGAWRNESDVIAQFIEDRVEFDPSASMPQPILWREFESWVDETGNASFKNARSFNKALREHPLWGSVTATKRTDLEWDGVRLKPTELMALAAKLAGTA